MSITLENIEGAIKNETPVTYGKQVKDKQSKNTTQYMLNTTIHKRTQIT